MKKRKIYLLIILAVILSGVLAYGNSGPVTWLGEEKRIGEIFSFDEDLNVKIRGFQNGASDAVEATEFRSEVEKLEVDIEHY